MNIGSLKSRTSSSQFSESFPLAVKPSRICRNFGILMLNNWEQYQIISIALVRRVESLSLWPFPQHNPGAIPKGPGIRHKAFFFQLPGGGAVLS